MNYNPTLIYKIFLALALAVGFIPNLGALDKIAPQWLFLNIIGLLFIVFFTYRSFQSFSELLKNKIFKILGVFILWIFISIFYAINPIESIVVFSQYFSWILIFILFYYSFKSLHDPFYFFSNLISFYLIIEILYVIIPLFDVGLKNDIGVRSNLFLGTAANINITAFSILYKIPFFVYSIYRLKTKKFLKTMFTIITISISFFIINTLLLTRSAILIVLLYTFIFILLGFFNRSFNKQNTQFSLIFLASFIISFSINLIVSNNINNSFSSSERLLTIAKNFDVDSNQKDGSIEQRLRFYSQAINQIKKAPFKGVGIGNWKIKSIEADKEKIIGYRVPYHVHNDFLELATEIGLFGLTLYVCLILIPLIFILKELKRLLIVVKNSNKLIITVCITLFFTCFLTDSMLNFPIARPIEIIMFLAVISFVSLELENNAVD